MKHSNYEMPIGQKQRGASLVITLIVLLVLTILGVSSTSSNRLQSVMARNNQFNLEAFNASRGEISAQLKFLNARALTEGVPSYISALEEEGPFEPVPMRSVGAGDYLAPSPNMQLLQRGGLAVGSTVGLFETDSLLLDVDSKVENTKIHSHQRQRFSIKYTAGHAGTSSSEETSKGTAYIP